MNFLISDALADAPAAAAPQGGMSSLLIMVGMLAVFYFILIRPQQKRAKEHKAMLAALAKGDEVVTAGGVLGKVSELNDNYVTLEVADGVSMKVQRHAVQVVLPKGTIKSA